jgi:tetrahydromethanopterin S-methyltransferase subunit F
VPVPDGLKADAKLGFGIAIGFFVFALLLVVVQLILARVKG